METVASPRSDEVNATVKPMGHESNSMEPAVVPQEHHNHPFSSFVTQIIINVCTFVVAAVGRQEAGDGDVTGSGHGRALVLLVSTLLAAAFRRPLFSPEQLSIFCGTLFNPQLFNSSPVA